MMEAQDVLDVMSVLSDAAVPVWLDGGWGVDALVGAQHRDHIDLDLVVDILRLEDLVSALGEVGFTVTTDDRPTRLALADRSGRQVDLHPVRFDADGDGWQAAAGPDGSDARYPAADFTFGWVGAKRVECISARLQMRHHSGYDPTEADRLDVHLLFEHFHETPPKEYR